MRIIGIDPGTATTGFGVIDIINGNPKFVDAGVITTPPGGPMSDRLVTLYNELTQVIAENKPDQAAVELLYFSANVTTGISVGQARGVVLLALAQAGMSVPGEYNPMQVKMGVTGYGGAKKPQVQEMVKMILGLNAIPKPDDAADALAVAITHANQAKISHP
ncbi:MAG: crossover junction endodeoxyribonuclease RuvC [Candidatus Saccharibacteria bacterium]